MISLGGLSTQGRYAAVANIPATATEVAVALCYTPTSATNSAATDYVSFSNIQLARNPNATSYVSATTGYNVGSTSAPYPALLFERRPAGIEALLQYRYYYQINEANTAGVIQGPGGYYDTTTTCSVTFPLPASMRTTPTLALGNLSATTFKISPTTTPVVLATPFAALQTGSTPAAPFTAASVSFKTASQTQYVNCDLVSTASGGGYFGLSAEE